MLTNPVPLPQHNKQSSPLVVDLVRQSRFQMDDDGDLHEQILHIEAHIEELTDIIERCRKIILFSKVAVAGCRWPMSPGGSIPSYGVGLNTTDDTRHRPCIPCSDTSILRFGTG